MLTKNHTTLTTEVKKHLEADAVIQGEYWDGSKGCFIGCLTHSDDAFVLQERFGWPLPLVKLCEGIFEALPKDEAKAFFADLPAAVGGDGKDLSRVHWGFLASELRALPALPAEQREAVDAVVAGVDKLFAGEEWSSEDAAAADAVARAAADAADAPYAAYASARAASDAARAAYIAARSAYAADAAARAAADAACAAADAARAADAAARAARAAAARAADAAHAARAADAAHAAAVRRQRDTILKLIKEA